MISRIIAAAQTLRSRPPGVLTAIAGAACTGIGLMLVQRYHQQQVRNIATAVAELETTEAMLSDRRAELERLRRELAEAERHAPLRIDADQLAQKD